DQSDAAKWSQESLLSESDGWRRNYLLRPEIGLRMIIKGSFFKNKGCFLNQERKEAKTHEKRPGYF
ncbi:MAG TPA: hypothetical protein PKX32_06625, partial [Candidatus Saccharicenans sp.]|nr:hypothetical protein [Candidatus Saccharicenans sp.]